MSATDLTGATFTVIGQYQVAGSNNPTITYNSGNQTAPTTVNPIPSGQGGGQMGTTSLTVTGNQITEQFSGMFSAYNNNFNGIPFSFSGYVINIGNGAPAISSVTLVSSSGINGGNPIISYTANSVSINQMGETLFNGANFTLNLTFAQAAVAVVDATPDYVFAEDSSGNNILNLANPQALNSILVNQHQLSAVYYNNSGNPNIIRVPDNLPEIFLSGTGNHSVVKGHSSPQDGNIVHNIANVTSGSWDIYGIDQVVVSGNLSDYSISPNGNGYRFYNNMTSAIIKISNSETIKFGDQTLQMNYSQSARDVLSMYHVALDRFPDFAGEAAWVNAISNGASEVSVAAAILASPEFTAVHGSNLTNKQFATLMYQSVYNTDPSATILALLEVKLETESRAQMFLDFATGITAEQYVIALVGVHGGVLMTAAA
jgi:hypothetical protein